LYVPVRSFSIAKIKQMGFKPEFKIEDAYNEIKKKIEEGEIKNFNDEKYSNYKLLFGSKKMQQRVFLEGI
jgi:hypothetical protein